MWQVHGFLDMYGFEIHILTLHVQTMILMHQIYQFFKTLF